MVVWPFAANDENVYVYWLTLALHLLKFHTRGPFSLGLIFFQLGSLSQEGDD